MPYTPTPGNHYRAYRVHDEEHAGSMDVLGGVVKVQKCANGSFPNLMPAHYAP